jgi:hypothetical protein
MQPGENDPNQQPPGSYPPPPPPYGAQQPYAGGPAAPQNTQGLVGMILGIAAIPLLCCLYLGVPVGIAAVIVSYLGLNKVKAGVANNRGQALAGLICGAVAVVLGIVGLIVSIVTDAWSFNSYNNM